MAQNHTQGGTHEQRVKAGQQSHKNTDQQASDAKGRDGDKQTSTRGRSHERHVKAGQQSHKNS